MRPRTTASVVADVVSIVAGIKEGSGRVVPLPCEAHEGERTIQALLDAISAIEHATEVLTHHGERALLGPTAAVDSARPSWDAFRGIGRTDYAAMRLAR